MGKLSRYYFLKRIYSDYLIIFYEKRKYIVYFEDEDILQYIGFVDNFRIIEKNHINYIIVTNLEIIKKVEWFDNQYDYYFKLIMVMDVVNFIERNKRSKLEV